MSISEIVKTVHVVAGRTIETCLIDHSFRMVGRGIGSFTVSLAPEGTLASQIPNEYVDRTPWLIWPVHKVVARSAATSIDELPYIHSVLRDRGGRIDEIVEGLELSIDEQQLISFLRRRTKFQEAARSSKAAIKTTDDWHSVARAFGITVGTAKATAAGLAEKLRAAPVADSVASSPEIQVRADS